MSDRPCQLCECPLLFVAGPNGKTIPLDTRAEVYRVVGDGESARAVRVLPTERIYVTHFRTCPHANAFSGSKR